MSYRNYINIDEYTKNLPIYRIIPFRYLIETFQKNQASLSSPKIWDDPFENYLLSCNFSIGNERCTLGFRDQVFAQCWSLKRESDALWRIYSADKNGVRVETTPSILLESLMNTQQNPDTSCFIGKVQYKSTKNLQNVFKSINLFDQNGSGIAESLLYKRYAFSHEREIRLIYINNNKENADRFEYKIEPNKIFKSILFDPRIEDNIIDKRYNKLKDSGCTVKLKRSFLYKPPKKFTFKVRQNYD